MRIAGAENGPTIMLAHGFGCDQNLWRLVEARLASSFRLVLFDHVGCGASDPAAWDPERYAALQGYADDILGIVRELDLRDVIYRRPLGSRDDGRACSRDRSEPLRQVGPTHSLTVLHRQ